MAKTEIFKVNLSIENIDGGVFPLPKDFPEREEFSLNEFYGFDKNKEYADAPPEEGYILTLYHAGVFTTMTKALKALEELGFKMEKIRNDFAISEPMFVFDDLDDMCNCGRTVTIITVERDEINTFSAEFEAWCDLVTDGTPKIDEDKVAFLNVVADACEKYGVERKDMKDFITMHVNDDFEGGN